MRAVTRHEYGGVAAIRMETLPRPAPGPGQVLVRVRAAGLDRAVLHLLTGTPYVARAAFGVRRPQQPIMGGELAGEVVALGPEVNDFAIGQRVFGTCRTAFAEYALARADQLAATPAGVSDEFAATLGISGGTAHQAVCRHGQVQAGQQVLILGASGGVGSFAVQIAAHLGATVTGVCSQAKTEFVTGLGAQRAVDYRRVEVAELGQRFDVIIDIAGNRPLATLRRALTPKGTLVIVGGEEGGRWLGGLHRNLGASLLNPFVRQRLLWFVAQESRQACEQLAKLAAGGAIRPAIDHTVGLADVAPAVAAMEQGRLRGKVVVIP
ncbi:MAG: NAD(P)-dependent alcohol dehydrogenase [Austwickia sp.]|nr:NAD(P)-dependent alcohol dehydrogenase [Austwickia sp.]